MINYVIQKIWNRKWMAISLIIGNVLLIGMVMGCTVYSNAVMNRVLMKELNQSMTETGKYPFQARMTLQMSTLSNSGKIFPKVEQVEKLVAGLPEQMQLKVKESVTSFYMKSFYIKSPQEKDEKDFSLELAFLSDIEKHCTMISGNMYSDKLVDGAIEVIVNRKTMMEQNLMVGQELYLTSILDSEGNPVKIRVAGVFDNTSDEDLYWVDSPDSFKKRFFMDEELFRSLYVNYTNPQYIWNSSWSVLFSYDDLKSSQVDQVLTSLKELNTTIEQIDCDYYKEYFGELLMDFQTKQTKLTNILLLLEIPIFILLAIFIYMVNNQMMLLERGDIAVLKSRGASNANIIGIYLLQGGIIAVIGLLLGIPLGLLFCYALGNANAFLEFVSRTALTIELTNKALLLAFLCAVFSIGITLVLAFIHTKETIVSHKRKMNQGNQRYLLWRFLAGAAFLGLALYGRYNFSIHADTLASSSETGAGIDPLLFLSSIFFIIGAAFIVISLFPIIINLIFYLGRNWWGPTAYASFKKVIKGSDNQGFIILFLILTVSLGIYSTSIARTINDNEENRIVYSTGADVVLQEEWESNEDELQAFVSSMEAMGQDASLFNLDVVYEEPDFNRYTKLAGTEKATKVLVNKNIKVSLEQGTLDATLMGINTKEFGETAYFKTDLLKEHWYNYLNAISQDEDGVLVSSNLRDVYGYKVGDMISYYDNDNSTRGKICGFVDYWPSYQPVAKVKDTDGIEKEIPQFLIVANLSKVQSVWGITPYQIWIRAKGSTSYLYDFAQENNIVYDEFKDLSAEIINKNNDPIFQGTNGILTLGFIIILLICAVGFLIFWIMSIFSRTLQFGVFRAMGMTVTEIIRMLMQEQLYLSVIPIALGLLIGQLVSKLYVPLIQIAYTSSEQIIPIEVIRRQSDQLRILIIVGFMVIFCMLIISKLISDLKMTQALKLGED